MEGICSHQPTGYTTSLAVLQGPTLTLPAFPIPSEGQHIKKIPSRSGDCVGRKHLWRNCLPKWRSGDGLGLLLSARPGWPCACEQCYVRTSAEPPQAHAMGDSQLFFQSLQLRAKWCCLPTALSPAANSYVAVLTRDASGMTSLGNRNITEVMRSLGWDLIRYDHCPYKRETLDIHMLEAWCMKFVCRYGS